MRVHKCCLSLKHSTIIMGSITCSDPIRLWWLTCLPWSSWEHRQWCCSSVRRRESRLRQSGFPRASESTLIQGRQLGCTHSCQTWEGLLHSADAVSHCLLRHELRIQFSDWNASSILEESLCKCVVFSLDAGSLLFASSDVEWLGTETTRLTFLVGGWAIGRRMLALGNVNKFV